MAIEVNEKILAAKLAEELRKAFVWNNTKEGGEYWNEVHAALIRLSIEGF